MNKYDSVFTFERIQFKSIEKVKKFCELFNEIEVEFWIRSGKIEFKEIFICPDITEDEFDTLKNSQTEKDIRDLLWQLEVWYIPNK